MSDLEKTLEALCDEHSPGAVLNALAEIAIRRVVAGNANECAAWRLVGSLLSEARGVCDRNGLGLPLCPQEGGAG